MYQFRVFAITMSCIAAVYGFQSLENFNCEDNPTAIVAHEKKCQLYYDCSRRHKYIPAYIKYYADGPDHLKPYVHECSYPFQFDSDMKTCRNFTETVDKCKPRIVEKDRCKYIISLGVPGSIHGRPCYIDNPSCKDLSDGFHPNPQIIGSPYFIMCYRGFLTYSGMCSVDEHNRRMFPIEGKCRSIQW